MASSKTEICNLGLFHIGVGIQIANIDTEKSNEATVMNRIYDTTLDEVLRDGYWPFASTIQSLALVSTQPNNEWAFAYRYPSDCLKVRRILSGVRNDTHQSRVPYKIIQDSQGLLILTDMSLAQIEYTVRTSNPLLMPSDFVMAFSLRLGSYAAPHMTGGDPFKMGDKALQIYQMSVVKAQANAINEEQVDQEPDSEFIRGR